LDSLEVICVKLSIACFSGTHWLFMPVVIIMLASFVGIHNE